MNSLRVLLVLLLLLSMVFTAGVIAANETYELNVDGEIGTPEQEETISGDEVVIDSVAVFSAGEDIVAEASGGDGWDVQLRDNSGDIIQSVDEEETDNGKLSIPTDSLDPGTYVLLLRGDDEFHQALPVVVSGYDISVDNPEDATVGEDIPVTVEVEQTTLDEPPESVEVTAHRPGTEDAIIETATHVEDDTYEATLSFEDAEPDEYNVYAAATDDDETDDGYPVIHGAEEGAPLILMEEESDDDDDDDGAGGGGGGGGAPPEDTDGDNESDDEDDTVENEPTMGIFETDDEETATAAVEATNIETIQIDAADIDIDDIEPVTVTAYDNDSDSVGSAPPRSVEAVNISVPEEVSDRSATVEFNVDAGTLSEQSLEPEDIRLEHGTDSGWEELATTVVDESSDQVTFAAETDGFSVFAITAVAEPNATATMTPDSPTTDDEVHLNASDSMDQYGEVTETDWTVTSDSFNETFTDETVTESFDAGEYNATVTVTNDAGKTDTASVDFTVEEPTYTLTVVTESETGEVLTNATVAVGDDELTVNESGMAKTTVSAGENTIEATAENYESDELTATVTGETTETIQLEASESDDDDDGVGTDEDTNESGEHGDESGQDSDDSDENGAGFTVGVALVVLSTIGMSIRMRE